MARNKPLPRALRYIGNEFNRGELLRRDKDDVKNITATIKDFDAAIMYYFNEVIKPEVSEQGEKVKVPVFYGNPERWKASRADGYIRDKGGQIITPVILFRRISLQKDEQVTVDKLDANKPAIFQTFKQKYSNVNRYDQFSTQTGLRPQKEIFRVSMPDFVTMQYQARVWTTYVEQMNHLIEQITYSDGSYWGEPGKFKFRVNVEEFTDASEISTEERLIRTEFNFNFRGYLLPEKFNDELTTKRFLSPKRLVFGTEVADLGKDKTGYGNLDYSKTAHHRQSPIVVGRGFDVQRPFSEFDPEAPDPETEDTLPRVGTEVRISTSNPLTLLQGTGITISNTGVAWDGSNNLQQTISIGQAVGTSADVTFNTISASSAQIGGISYGSDGIQGSVKVTGSLDVTSNSTIDGNLTVGGILTAQEVKTEFVSASILFTSGSSKFGDTQDDSHTYTGSLALTGSLVLNGYTVNEISNDTSLADSSATALVTENAVRQFATTDLGTKQDYLRKSFFKTSNSIVNIATASFNATTASAPTDMTATNENDFVFFINGQYMEHDALSIKQVSTGSFHLMVDNSSIGYNLESDDEIIALGKFNT